MWCMRYNPSQASSLLLDPSISADSAKFHSDFGGFCIQDSEGLLILTQSVFLNTLYPLSFDMEGHKTSIGIRNLAASPQSSQIL